MQAVYDAKARFLCLADGSPTELFKSIVTTSEATKMLPTTAGLYVDDDIGAAKIRTIQRYVIFLL
jgi:peroxisome-assembly ATPase